MKKIILTLVAVLTLLPLFKPGLFDVHDPTSIVRFFALHETLKAGQFPGSWSNLLNQGFGYPLFLYYAPVFSYLGVIVKIFVPSYLLALKLSLGIMVLTSVFGMYKLMESLVGKFGAFVSSVAYATLPYHAATLYVRGSYAEGMTWAILPWLLFLWSRSDRDHRWIALTSITTTLFFLSHNSLPFAFIPLLLVWILVFGTKYIRQTIFAILLSVGLSLWFLLPVLFERNLVQIDAVATATRFSDHFLAVDQLWHSAWGYGGSAKIGEVDGMSFMLGKLQLILAGLALIGITAYKKWSKQVVFFLFVLVFYSFMATGYSSGVWLLVPGLSILQFPWRLLAFAGFGLAALSGYLVYLLPRKLQLLVSVIVSIGLIFFNLKFFVPQTTIAYKDSDLLSQEKLDTVAAGKIPEYLPVWMPSFPDSTVDDGLSRTATKVSGDFINDTARPVMISTAYMPQWKLQVDGKDVGIRPTSIGSIVSDTIEPGSHSLSLTWHRTLIENIGLGIAAITIIVVIGLLII